MTTRTEEITESSCSSGEGLQHSQLGRHEYWEEAYRLELQNLNDVGDEGEIWFGASTLETMVNWTESILKERGADPRQTAVLDVGTGNGSFLCSLRERGYVDLTGSDYSAASIALATAVAARRETQDISWVQDDLLHSKLARRFDIITDKGTLDAIGLSESPQQKRRQYREAVWQLLRPGGLLIITSCNSTSEELQEEFCYGEEACRFHYVSKVNTYPKFRFGGREGTRVCTLAFSKQR